jgi:sec-independent protein translocase protein TatA
MRLGIWEIAIILVVAMLFFGPKRISDIGGALGKSIRGFKRGMAGEDEPAGKDSGTPPPPAA